MKKVAQGFIFLAFGFITCIPWYCHRSIPQKAIYTFKNGDHNGIGQMVYGQRKSATVIGVFRQCSVRSPDREEEENTTTTLLQNMDHKSGGYYSGHCAGIRLPRL